MSVSRYGNDTGDARLDLALAELADLTGVTGWSIRDKRKSIAKFGRRTLASGTPSLIWASPPANEALINPADGNLIDTISSSNTGDTEVIQIEGHYYDPDTPAGPGLVFHIQRVTLDGRNKVTLSQPLMRTDRMFVVVSATGSPVAGNVHVYEDTALTNGVPTDTTKIHNTIPLGESQSFKMRLSTSWKDALIVMGGQLSIERGSNARVDFRLEGKPALVPDAVFRPAVSPVTLATAGTNFANFERPIPGIIPPNFDLRVSGTATANNTDASVTVFGYFAVRPDPL